MLASQILIMLENRTKYARVCRKVWFENLQCYLLREASIFERVGFIFIEGDSI